MGRCWAVRWGPAGAALAAMAKAAANVMIFVAKPIVFVRILLMLKQVRRGFQYVVENVMIMNVMSNQSRRNSERVTETNVDYELRNEKMYERREEETTVGTYYKPEHREQLGVPQWIQVHLDTHARHGL